MARRELSREEWHAQYTKEFKAQVDRVLRPEFEQKLATFLADRRISDGGWATVTPKDVEQLDELVGLLIDLKCARDPDGDRTIEHQLTNRITHTSSNFQPVPYEFVRMSAGHYRDTDEAMEAAFDAAEFNLSIAMERFKILNASRRNRRRRREEDRNSPG